MQSLTRNTEIRFDTRLLKSGVITVYIDGDDGGGKVAIHAMAGDIRAVVADAGPFGEEKLDSFNMPVKRLPIAGGADYIIVSLSGAVNPNLRVEVI